MKPSKVLIVEPRRLPREALCLVLQDQPWTIEAIGGAEECPPSDRAACPALVLWGLGVPREALRPEMAALRLRFAEAGRTLRHAVLASAATANTADLMASLDIEALLLDDVSIEVLRRSLELVMLGQRVFPVAQRSLAEAGPGQVLPFPTPHDRANDPASAAGAPEITLSERETQVLQHLVEGASNKAIARFLQITEATVKVHVKTVVRKLGVANRTQAAIWALQNRNGDPHPGEGPAVRAARG